MKSLMTNLCTLLLITILGFSPSQSCTQSPTTSEQVYRIHTIQFHYGMADKGMNIGMKFFSQGLSKIDKEVFVLKSMTGQWDALVIEPVENDSPFEDAHQEDLFDTMKKIAGSEEELIKALGDFDATVMRQEYNYVKSKNKINLKSGSAYRLRSLQAMQGKSQNVNAIGSKYFSGALNQYGIYNAVLSSYTGAYDYYVLEEINKSDPFNENREGWADKLLEIAGSQDKLESDMKTFNQSMISEKIDYFTCK